MKYGAAVSVIWLLTSSAIFAQVGAAPKGDNCVGYITLSIIEVMPETLLGDNIYDPITDTYARGQVHLLKETIDAQVNTVKCPHRRHVVTVNLDLKMQTDIVGLGVNHPYDGSPRTQAGIDRSKEHESIHRARFRAAFNDFKSRLTPPANHKCDGYTVMMAILNPIKKQVEDDWKEIKRQEGPIHDTDQWREWYRTRGPIW